MFLARANKETLLRKGFTQCLSNSVFCLRGPVWYFCYMEHIIYIPISMKVASVIHVSETAVHQSCLINLWLLFSSFYRTCSPKTTANLYFYDLVFSLPLARKETNALIYSKHEALRSM